MATDFVHLHLHTQSSLLDGLGSSEDYVAEGVRQGSKAMAITDHGNLSGVPAFYMECRKAGIEPVLGQEFYFVPDAANAKTEKDQERFHVVMLAKGINGFRVLSDLSTEGHRRFYGKPLIDRPLIEDLGDDARHLVVLSGCAASVLSRMVLHKIPGDVDEELAWWRRPAWDFYVELQHHNTSFDRNLNRRLLRVARRHKLPWVITNDPHYVWKKDCGDHDALLAIQTASDIDDPKRFRFEGSGYHLRTAREMERAFREYGSEVFRPGMAQTLRIARACQVRIPALEKQSWHIPPFPRTPKGLSSNQYLKRLVGKGLREKGLLDDEETVARARTEMRLIEEAKVADFLLISWDIIRYARKVGIRTGPGRGSICASTVAWLCGIHKVPPLRYGLPFERFLNPERPKAPDVDSDVDPNGRPKIFRYVDRTYGEENVMRVANFTTMATRRAFQSLARAYGIDHLERNRLSSQITETEDGEAILPPEITEHYPDLVASLEKLTGVYSSIMRHAAGVLILDPQDPVREIVPQMWIVSSKEMVSQYNLASVEALRLLKQDILSLRNLSTIDFCIRFVRENQGIEIEPDDWVPDEEKGDKAVYRMLAKGDTIGVFQMEGGANTAGIQKIKPTCFQDIYNCTGVYRKGPIDAGSDKRFLKNRKDKKVRVFHESLRPILSETWGEMIYDEQMFEILNICAGFTWAQVDDAKTAMKKKDPKRMAALRTDMIRGFRKTSGMSKKEAIKVADMMAAQSAYLFSKTHAVAYSLLTYQTAKLKHDYPLEFMAALIATVDLGSEAGKEKRIKYLGEAMRMGFDILPPDVNLSEERAKPEGDSAIRMGLNEIKGVGEPTARSLVNRRKGGYETTLQVEKAVNNKAAFAVLGESGALESVGRECDHSKQDDLLSWQFHDPLGDLREKWSKKLKPPRGNNGEVLLCGQIIRIDKKTTRNGKNYRTWKLQWRPGQEWTVSVFDGAGDLFDLKTGSIIALVGKWNTEFRNVAVWDSETVRVLQAVRAS